MEKSGVPYERTAFVSFTNATINNLTDRLQLNDNQKQYFKTVHSMCYHLLGIRRGHMAHEHLQTFPGRFSADFLTKETRKTIENINQVTATDSVDDGFYIQMMKERTELLPRNFVPPQYSHIAGLYLNFKQRYHRWLQDNRYVDFVGLLEQALEEEKVPPVDLLCVDEWQDLTPLQVQLVNLWSQNIPYSVHAGDDDQTIHEWAGAQHQDFLDFPTFTPGEKEVIVLNKTYRLPPRVLDMSVHFIKRNKKRVDKEFTAVSEKTGIVDYTHIDKVAEVLREQLKYGTCKVLVRNNALISHIMKDLSVRNIPVSNNKALADCVRSISIVKQRKKFLSIDDLYFISQPNNSVFPAAKFFKRGGKKELRVIADALATEGRESIDINELLQFKVKDEFVLAITNGDISDLHSPYLQEAEVIYNQYGEHYRPVEITTIHKAKGTEADTVVVCLDVVKRTYTEARDPARIEEERRVWYVAMTRTKKNLLFLRPTYQYFYPSPMNDYIKLYLEHEQHQ